MHDILDANEATVLLGKLQTFARWAEKTFQNLQRGAT
jgi:hypothetical protein